MTAESEYLAWRKKPPVGCVFARLLSARPKDFAVHVDTVPTGRSPDRIAADIEQRVAGLVATPATSSATLLFPGLTSLEGATRIMLALGGLPGWSVTTTLLQPPPAMDLACVHISRQIPFGNATCASEALLLGPFRHFPPTRRAPIVALEIFVGEPMTHDPKTGAPTVKSNLAHIKMELPSNNAFETMWSKSIEGRMKSLGGDDNRAKAKVAFVIPLAMARRLRCEP